REGGLSEALSARRNREDPQFWSLSDAGGAGRFREPYGGLYRSACNGREVAFAPANRRGCNNNETRIPEERPSRWRPGCRRSQARHVCESPADCEHLATGHRRLESERTKAHGRL